ncbi:Long-chain-fatty-acid--CoA ligase 3 [Fragariocoptes setiger]|uniref:long-chain-fatty-acid--CoA ligase n=1 Tax=Fragariocoptes setiger TaxID=1670756 RepID=A0ABQ7SCL8_9ACAR|nr:Long-chain-fatty-acid--CoA ligase 3 [Fragariocoptes setiger]
MANTTDNDRNHSKSPRRGKHNELASVKLIRWFVNVYDVVTLPIYYLVQQPWKVRTMAYRQRAKQINHNTWVNVSNDSNNINMSQVSTLDDLFRQSVKDYAPKACLGYRKILAVEKKPKQSSMTDQSTGRARPPQDRYVLDDDYTWLTYEQVDQMVQQLSVGLLYLAGESPFGRKYEADQHPIPGEHDDYPHSDDAINSRIIIVADTCMQWFLLAHACFRINVTVVTAYTTLDDAAISHSINQTEARTIVVSQKFASRLQKILRETRSIETVIVLDDPLPGERDVTHSIANMDIECQTTGTIRRVNATNFNQLLAEGQRHMEMAQKAGTIIEHDRPKPMNIAFLMYTSGSTGLSKGVMLSHKNIVYTALSFSGPGDLSSADRYIGYLPLGIFLRNGATIAYSSHLTLTDFSPAIKRGQRGDATLFKPTIVAAVPLILERMKIQISNLIESKGAFWHQLYDYVIEYKRYWLERCYTTPIMDRLLCSSFRNILGGQVRAICSGGAALPKDTHEYLRHVMNTLIVQGYGTTETSAAASFSDIHDTRYDVSGPPYPMVELKLEDWDDYKVTDKPYPRGEIIIGGQPVSMGYYKLDEQTRESFFMDPVTKTRYFRTGDIGQMYPDGVLQIIDRKKDIVKPLSGEYISLVQVESVLKTALIVDNVCVHCSPYSNNIVALIVPNLIELKKLVVQLIADNKLSAADVSSNSQITTSLVKQQQQNADNESTFNNNSDTDTNNADNNVVESLHEQSIDLTRATTNETVVSRVLEILTKVCTTKSLKRSHIPARIRIVCDEWTAESGLLTASFKIRRRQIQQFYAQDILEMYQSMGVKISSV